MNSRIPEWPRSLPRTYDNHVYWTTRKYVLEHLRDDQRMKEIVNEHLEEVDKHVRTIINDIINEDQYHLINKQFFDTIEFKSIERIDNVANTRLRALEERIVQLESQITFVGVIGCISVAGILTTMKNWF